jgi:TonB family protein
VVALAAGWNVNCPRYLDEVSTAGSKRKDCLRDCCNPVTDRRGLHVSMDNGNDRFAGGSASDTAVTPSRAPAHISEFAPVSQALAVPRCGDIRPPEALLTPDPLLQAQDDDLHVRVSFIVGVDGRVHSAFVVDSGGPVEDRVVLQAVRFWRYRPALCNGVPTDYEALVRFSVR